MSGRNRKTTKNTSSEKAPTLLDLFLQRDFSNTMRMHDTDLSKGDLVLHWKDGSSIRVNAQLYLDFPAKTKFVGFYVFRSSSFDMSAQKTFQACMTLLSNDPSTKRDSIKEAFHHFTDEREIAGGSMDRMNTSDELTFSGRVLLYYEENMSIVQKADIIKAFGAKNYDVQFMGPEYLQDQLSAWYREHDENKQ